MAVEIPVYVDISSGFKYAAAQIPKEMPKLESAVKKNVLNVPVYLSGNFKTVRDVLTSTTISAKELEQVLRDISYNFERAANAAAAKKNTPAEVNNLAKAYGFVEQRLTGIYNKDKVAGMQVSATIKKVQYQIEQLRRQLTAESPGSEAFNKINYQIKVQEERLRKLNFQYERYKILAMKASNSVVTSTEASNGALSRQLGITRSLATMAASYLSIWQLGRFMQNVRQVTSEFEMQRVALAGIIQDTAKAESLFRQIKAAAIESPFEIKDLVSYTKQLSAYRVETDKLFDVTTRLADVSAGLGVDMGRLILAYGQVRAASVLRGQELRQFTEAGIPLVDLLAKKFTELNGSMTTTGEVFELISKRAVPFSMIEEIFEDMTEAGGTFYKMQERQAETLAGQWANLKDAISIMYDEIGNTPAVHKAMEDLIGGARTLMSNWRQIANILKVVGANFLVIKLASLFVPKLAWNTELAAKATNALELAEALEEKQAKKSIITRQWAIKGLERYATQMGKAAAASTMLGRTFRQAAAGFLRGGWIGIVTTAVTVLTGVIVSAIKKANELKNELTKIDSEGGLQLNRSVSNFNRLAKAAVEATDGSKEQNDALNELKRTYGDIIPSQELEIEKLRDLNGEYSSLTKAIEEKINMQIKEQKINAIQDAFSSKLTKETKRAKRILSQYGLDKDQIRAVLDEVGKETEAGLINMNDSVEEQAEKFRSIIQRMTGIVVDFNYGFQDSSGAWHSVYDQSGKALKTLKGIVGIYSDLGRETKAVENDMKPLIGTMGTYADRWIELEKALKGVSASEELFGEKTTFAYKEEVLRQRVEMMVKAIEDAFVDTGIDITPAFKTPGHIDFKFIAEAAEQGAAKGNWGLDSYVKNIQKKYDELVPSDMMTETIKVKFQDIANSVGISMNDVQGYLKKSNEDTRQYAKGIKDSLQEAQDTLKEMEKRNAESEIHPVLTPVSDADRKKQVLLVQFLKELLQYLDAFDKHTKPSGRDTRLSQLKSDISELTNAYKTLQELKKYKTEDEAIIDINRLFPQLKGSIPSLDYVVSELEKRLDQVKADLKKSPKSKTLLDMQRTLETEISNLRFDDLKDKLEKKLKKVSEEVKRSEAARNFYKDIFDLTGDETLATSLSVEVYGGIGDEFKERLQQQLAALFEGVEVDDAMRNAIDTQDFDYIFANLPEGMEKVREELKKLREDNEKFSAEQIKTWVNELKKAKTYGEERVRIARTTQERIAEINRSSLPEDEKKSLISQYVARESKEVAKLQYEAFKDSPMYIALFEDLDAASGRMLENMRKRLVSLRGQWSSLDPVQLKEMQKRMEEIDSSMARRNPFKALSKSIKEYQELLASGRTRKGDEEAAVIAEQNRQTAEANLEAALKDLAVKEAAYEQSLKQNTLDSTTTTLLYGQMKAANALVDARRKEADAATKSANQAQENANQWSRLSSSVLKSVEAMSTFSVAVQALKKNVHDIVDLFAEMSGSEGLSEAADLLESMAEAAGNAASGLARVLAGDISGAGDLLSAKMSGIQLILQAVNMINNAQLRDWDRQMEEQEKTLARLQRSYDKLGEAMENAFGSDYLYNYNEQLKNLAAQQEAYEKQLAIQQQKSREASRDEDRKAAADEAENLKKQITGVEKQTKEVTQSMQEFFAGTDLTSAAEAFADSWLDAYREFGDTTGAIKEKMQEMIDNLIVKSVLAGAAKAILQPFFDEIEKLGKANDLTPENIAKLATMLNGKVQGINDSMSSLMTVLQSLGIKTRGQIGSFTGIARDIASASEESILGLAAGINTQNYYMSYVPMIHTNLEQVLALMGGSPTTPTVAPSAAEEGPAMPSVQEMVYDHLPNMDRNLADIKQMLSDVIKPVGTTASKYVATRM